MHPRKILFKQAIQVHQLPFTQFLVLSVIQKFSYHLMVIIVQHNQVFRFLLHSLTKAFIHLIHLQWFQPLLTFAQSKDFIQITAHQLKKSILVSINHH